MIKAVLFDIDDTLYQYEHVHAYALKKVFQRINRVTKTPIPLLEIAFDISKKQIAKQLIWGAASHNKELQLQRMFEHIHTKIKPSFLIELYMIYRDTFIKKIKVEPGIVALMKYLQTKNIKIGIVTDMTAYIQYQKMEKLAISDYIDVLVTSEEAWEEKPHPSIYLLAAYKLWVLANECIMVWDNVTKDVEWAQALWMQGVWIRRDDRPSKWIRPTYTTTTTKEMICVIKEIINISH